MRERIARRELYRRCSRMGEVVIDAAERVMYAVMKQNRIRATDALQLRAPSGGRAIPA